MRTHVPPSWFSSKHWSGLPLSHWHKTEQICWLLWLNVLTSSPINAVLSFPLSLIWLWRRATIKGNDQVCSGRQWWWVWHDYLCWDRRLSEVANQSGFRPLTRPICRVESTWKWCKELMKHWKTSPVFSSNRRAAPREAINRHKKLVHRNFNRSIYRPYLYCRT